SVVAARTATLPNPQSTKGQRKIIQHDEDFLGRNLKELGNREKRMAAPVHVTGRLNQRNIAKSCRSRIPFARFLPSRSGFVREKIDNHEADVMASARVFGARIAQACNQANR